MSLATNSDCIKTIKQGLFKGGRQLHKSILINKISSSLANICLHSDKVNESRNKCVKWDIFSVAQEEQWPHCYLSHT